jgi:DNA-directed RNA polymerase specialized sigma subunit
MKIQDKYYKETEYLLYNYKMFQISVENMQMEIEYLEKEDSLKGLNYDNISTSPTHKINSITEDIALSVSEKIHFLEHNINRNKRILERIDRAMCGLTRKERTMLELRYIEGMRWESIVSETNYSERHCRRIRSMAINKMIVGMFGGSKDENKDKPQ